MKGYSITVIGGLGRDGVRENVDRVELKMGDIVSVVGSTNQHKCNQILRVLNFGINILKKGEIRFKPFSGGTPSMVKKFIEILEVAHDNSTLPERSNEDEFRNWLYDIRIDVLRDETRPLRSIFKRRI